ncbi:hypothetical protein FXB42_11950 [Acetobacterium wieringae]|uniref:Uncharacterized protein n=1 Tax=Acetobacterium wieringae TaxID=52694 RepID=A0A5D0WK91_9FIRM|nr:hypothetical protein [Acetobacterium wieringae]TYC84474.1 hypothetical protein FXB42_11950 [Acetobacterium wieringae]
MNDFISTVRTDRLREIGEKERTGIVIADKYKYRLVDTIIIPMSDEKNLIYGFQVNQKDVYFYIIDEGANSYYTIIELYELLKYMCDSGNEDIVFEVLKRIEEIEMKRVRNSIGTDDTAQDIWENRADFIYRGITYHFKAVEYPEYDGIIEMPDGARTLSYQQVFLLLNLIQEKSNAFFTRGESNKKELINGITRLFLGLLSGKEDHDELKSLGWFYDTQKNKYVLRPNMSKNKERKYYLTKEEYLIIMNKES